MDKAKQVTKQVYARGDLYWTEGDDRRVAQVRQTAPQVERLGPAPLQDVQPEPAAT